jgi:hypothetical protein
MVNINEGGRVMLPATIIHALTVAGGLGCPPRLSFFYFYVLLKLLCFLFLQCFNIDN